MIPNHTHRSINLAIYRLSPLHNVRVSSNGSAIELDTTPSKCYTSCTHTSTHCRWHMYHRCSFIEPGHAHTRFENSSAFYRSAGWIAEQSSIWRCIYRCIRKLPACRCIYWLGLDVPHEVPPHASMRFNWLAVCLLDLGTAFRCLLPWQQDLCCNISVRHGACNCP